MHGRDEIPWLTVRSDEIERLERLASLVDEVSDDPSGLATVLRKTPTYVRSISGAGLSPNPIAARRGD
jgi:hypothetical protein